VCCRAKIEVKRRRELPNNEVFTKGLVEENHALVKQNRALVGRLAHVRWLYSWLQGRYNKMRTPDTVFCASTKVEGSTHRHLTRPNEVLRGNHDERPPLTWCDRVLGLTSKCKPTRHRRNASEPTTVLRRRWRRFDRW
jgi:hypothetical protein